MEDKHVTEPWHQRRLAVEMLFTSYSITYLSCIHTQCGAGYTHNILWNVFVYILYIFTIILIMLSYLISYSYLKTQIFYQCC